MRDPQVRVILFDFGGVLLKLRDPVRTFGIGHDRDSFNNTWLMSEAVRALECGQIGIDEFASRAVQEFDLPYSEREFLERAYLQAMLVAVQLAMFEQDEISVMAQLKEGARTQCVGGVLGTLSEVPLPPRLGGERLPGL